MVGTGLGAGHGVLIKDAEALETAHRVNAIIFDKTGTLTEGKPRVTAVRAVAGTSEEELLALEYSLEQSSSHPVAAAIIEEAKRRGVQPAQKPDSFEAVSGFGVRGSIGGKQILAGTERFMQTSGIDTMALRADIDTLMDTGSSITIVAVNSIALGVIGVADTVKPSAASAITKLRSMGVEVVMISGDHERVARTVAGELGIERFFAQVLPEEKASYVTKLQQEGKKVAMVGDGINDAPALAAADVGIAIATGTDVAIEAADITLVNKDLMSIVTTIALSRRTMRTIKQNLFWAFGYNIILIPIAMGVLYPINGVLMNPIFASAAMAASSISVVLNSLLLKKRRM